MLLLCLIFKTVNEDLTSIITGTKTLTNQISVLGNSFSDIWNSYKAYGIDGIKNLFANTNTNLLTSLDKKMLTNFFNEVSNGVPKVQALEDCMYGASKGARQLAISVDTSEEGLANFKTQVDSAKTAEAGYTAATVGARIATVALQTAISFGIALAVQGLITLFQKLSSVMPTIENTGTWLKESSEKVKTTKNEITNLNEKLTTTQNRIDELKAKTKDGLSIVEQNELDKLTQLNSELKAQIELQKYSLSEAQTKTINNFVESVKAIGNHSFGSDIPWWVSLIGGNSIKNLSSVYTDSIKFADNVKSFNETGNADVTWMQSYYESLQQVKGYLGDFDYSLLPKDAQATLDYIQDVQNALLIVRDKGENAQTVFDNIYDSQRFSGAKQSIEELKNSGQLTAETLQNLYNNDTTTNGVRAMISNMQQVGLVTDDSKKSFELLTNQVLQANNAVETVATTEKISFSDLINDDEVKTKIADFETQLSTLSQALEDVRNGNLSNSKFVTLIKKFPELAAHTNDLESAIRNLIETEKTEVNTQFDKWKDKVTDEDISKVNTLNESLKATGDIIQKISTKSLKTVIDDLENVNSKISDIISDYNTNKYFTLENLEDLSNIAPEYLNFLVNENGQISLNTKAYKAYLTSKAKSLLVDNLETLYSTILGMSAEEAQAYKNKKAYDEETDSVKTLLTATTQLYYTKAVAKDKANNTTAYTDAMKTAFSTASAYASICESYINSLSSSQNELSSSTDSATSSLNSEKTALENAKDALEDQKTALENTKTGYENAKSSIESLIDWVEKYIKQTKNDEIDALEKKKSAIDDLIDSQKELLEAEKDEYDWNKTIKEKQNSVASDALAASIASLDDSSAGKKAQKEANDKLASSKSDMFDSLYDHEIDLRKDALDNLKDAQDDYYDKEIDKLNDYLDDETQIYKDACSMIDNDNGTLYNKLLTYCKKYTTTTEAEFNNMWTSAKTALTNYNTANLNTYDLINDLQQSIYNVDSAISAVEKSISSYSDAIDTIQTKIDKLSSSASTAASKISSLGSSSLGTNNYNLDASQFSSSSSSSSSSGSSNSDKSTSSGNTDSNNKTTKPVLANRWYVTLGKTRYESTMPSLGLAISDLIRKYIADVGYDNANISLINQKTVHHYATGTESAKGGLSLVGEKGAELRVLNPGDGILNNQIVRGLTALGTNPSQFIADAGKKLLSNIFGNNIKPNFSAITPNNSQEISIVNNIQGDVNQSTLKALVAAQKQIIQDSVKAVQSQSVKMRASNRV